MSDPIAARGFGICAQGIGFCAFTPLNSTSIKVLLVMLGLFFISAGIYGAAIAPHMWGSYVVIGSGVAALLLVAVMIISKIIAQAILSLSRRRERLH